MTGWRNDWIGRCCGVAWVLSAIFGVFPACAASDDQTWDVVFLSSYRRGLLGQRALEQGVGEGLSQAAGKPIRIHYEFLDSEGLPEPDVQDGVSALLEHKYRHANIKAVIAWGPPAARIADRHHVKWGDPPLIMIEGGQVSAAFINRRHGDLAFGAEPAYQMSVIEALRLSKAERIIVIGDGSSRSAVDRVSNFKKSIEEAKLETPIEYWLDRRLIDLERNVATLPPGTIIYYLLMFSDGDGAPIVPFDAAQRLAAVASVPMFSTWETIMGSGVVGGAVLSLRQVGHDVGLTLRRLREGDAPLPPASAMRHVYDVAQLQRWGWRRDELPADAQLINIPHNLMEEHAGALYGGLATILVLGAGVAALAMLLRSRNRALAALAAERAGLERRILARTAELARSNAELEQFAYAVSHDLRQPLRTISAYAKLLEHGLGDALAQDLKEFLHFITSGARRLDAMTLGLLAYSRVGRNEAAPELIPLDEVARTALDDLAAAIADRRAVITVENPLPVVLGRRQDLERLFQNLIANAIKYTPADATPEVTLSATLIDAHAVVLIADRGPGVPEAQRERAFGMFQRLVGPGQCEGSGVGLALCRKIMQHHGGTIAFEDNPGGGAVLRLTFPPPPEPGLSDDRAS